MVSKDIEYLDFIINDLEQALAHLVMATGRAIFRRVVDSDTSEDPTSPEEKEELREMGKLEHKLNDLCQDVEKIIQPLKKERELNVGFMNLLDSNTWDK